MSFYPLSWPKNDFFVHLSNEIGHAETKIVQFGPKKAYISIGT